MFVFRTLTALALMVFLLGGAISHVPGRGFVISLVTSAAAQDPSLGVNPVNRLRVGRPRWRRRGELIYGDMTIRNANRYAVHNVTVECDFFGKWGNQVGTKAAEIQRVFARGRTRVRGIRFDVLVPNMQGGACRVVSAARVSLREHFNGSSAGRVVSAGPLRSHFSGSNFAQGFDARHTCAG